MDRPADRKPLNVLPQQLLKVLPFRVDNLFVLVRDHSFLGRDLLPVIRHLATVVPRLLVIMMVVAHLVTPITVIRVAL